MGKGSGKEPDPKRRNLRPAVVRPAPRVPTPDDSATAAMRMTVLAHELANLLDGSLRCLSILKRSFQKDPGGTGGRRGEGGQSDLHSRLDTLHQALEQMGVLVRLIGVGREAGDFSTSLPGGTSGMASLADAVTHATAVMQPVALDRGIELDVHLAEGLGHVPSMSIYRVIADAVRNAIESVQDRRREGGPGGDRGCRGRIQVSGGVEEDGEEGRVAWVEVRDDGTGPMVPAGDEEKCFRFGFTTKVGGSGVGLALAHEIVVEHGGCITLRARDEKAPMGKRGAVLRIELPVPHDGEGQP